MSKFLWILGAASLGVAAYVILSDRSPSFSTGSGLDDFTDQADLWGAKQRVTGTGSVLGGKLEQGFGKLTDDPAREGEGVLDETIGRVKDAAGQAAHAVTDAVSDARS